MQHLTTIAVLATLALGACSSSITSEETGATAEESTSLYHQSPPINAFQISEYTYYGPGHEGYLLYDEYNQVNGMLEVKNSPTYLFLNVVPTPPWLASTAAAEAWASAPAALDPETFTAQRTLEIPADTVQMWLPIPRVVTQFSETLTVMDDYVYIAVVAGAGNGESRNALAPLENGKRFVQFRVSSYSQLPDPEAEEISATGSSSSVNMGDSAATADDGTKSSSSSSDDGTENAGPSTEDGSSSSPVASSSSDADADVIHSSSSSEMALSSSAADDGWNICGKTADGRTIGFWKNNIAKYLAGLTKGTQVSATAMKDYLDQTGVTAEEALATLSSHSSDPRDLLARQLMASRLNFARAAYMDGNESYTAEFIGWGLDMLLDAEATNAELLAAKDLFDAYNNSHGQAIGMNCAL